MRTMKGSLIGRFALTERLDQAAFAKLIRDDLMYDIFQAFMEDGFRLGPSLDRHRFTCSIDERFTEGLSF